MVESLEKQGLMTDFGNIKIEEAKQNGQWDKETQPSTITDKQIQMICDLIKQNELAYTHFQGIGWEYSEYVPFETRGVGDIETLTLIFQKDK